MSKRSSQGSLPPPPLPTCRPPTPPSVQAFPLDSAPVSRLPRSHLPRHAHARLLGRGFPSPCPGEHVFILFVAVHRSTTLKLLVQNLQPGRPAFRPPQAPLPEPPISSRGGADMTRCLQTLRHGRVARHGSCTIMENEHRLPKPQGP